MKTKSALQFSCLLFAAMLLSACSSDPNQPASLQQQQAAMHTAPPSADAYKDAMSKVHFKTPSDTSMPKPPDGGSVPR